MDPHGFGRARFAGMGFVNRMRRGLDGSRQDLTAADAPKPEPQPAAARVLHGENDRRSYSLYAPLVPGGARGGAGEWLADALVLALGAVFAGGLALLAAAGFIEFILPSGVGPFGR